MLLSSMVSLFHVDILSIVMISLVSFIGIVVSSFSINYMKGDALYRVFFLNIFALLVFVVVIAIADNIALFLCAWLCCNIILERLMVHKSTWQAAKASGRLAIRNFIFGFLCIIFAIVIFYKTTESFSIQYIVHNSNDYWYTLMGLILLLIGAMTQSGIWPFHRWLISSLNSPTPVSAIMHAGIINGGGFLLARFAPLYLRYPIMLNIIFILGLTSAILGSLWKLMQHDVKRMLACSTMGQMGFMFLQFGLGFFASGVAHLFWHGIFKAYLFLASGSVAQEKRIYFGDYPSLICVLLSLACGALGSYIFAKINHHHWFVLDASLVIVGIVFIVGVQLSLTLLYRSCIKNIPQTIMMTVLMATFYGTNVYLFDSILFPLHLMKPQPLTVLHLIALSLLGFVWLLMLYFRYSISRGYLPNWLMFFYVTNLNSSQPHPETITSYRKGYDYV